MRRPPSRVARAPRALLALLLLVGALITAQSVVAAPLALAQTSAVDTSDSDGGDSKNVMRGVTGDPLSSNGLNAASCRSGSPLTARQAANCRASGSPASRVPVNHYQFDIHINTSMLGLGSSDVMMVIQNIIIQPIWIALLWMTHGVTVLLGWCFELNLFNRQLMGPIAEALGDAKRLFTNPWLQLTIVLSAAPLLYVGLVRRRVGDGLSQLGVTLVMLTVGLWIIANPFGSVGWLANSVQKASLSTVSAFSNGRVTQPELDFNRALENVVNTALRKPYAYLEFGNVDWGTNPDRRDRRLFEEESIQNAVALHAGLETLCSKSFRECVESLGDEDKQAQIKATEAELLRRARSAPTNADLFLTFPANGMARNSINDDKSLYKTLCQPEGGDKDCTGDTRHQANFRKQGQTFNRLAGVLLIGVGLLGLVFLLIFIAFRLLAAALFSLFYLLLTPVAVVMAPLGEMGHRHFKTWAIRLFGAIISKLIFSVFLGVVLLVVNVLSQMGSFGFWTQWFLIAGFYWLVWLHRDQVLEFLHIGHREMGSRGASAVGEILAMRSGSRMAGNVAGAVTGTARASAQAGSRAMSAGRDILQRRSADRELAVNEQRQASIIATSRAAREHSAAQTDRSLRAELDGHRAQAAPITRLRTSVENFQRQEAQARQRGDYAGAESLRSRAAAVSQILSARRMARPLSAASDDVVAAAEDHQQRTGSPIADSARRQRSEWLDRQAQTPAREGDATAIANGSARDYARLASLVDEEITPDRYQQLPEPQRALLNRGVDAQLDQRRAAMELIAAGRTPTQSEVSNYVAAHHRAGAATGGPESVAGSGTPAQQASAAGETRSREQLERERMRRQFGAVDHALQDRLRERHTARQRRRHSQRER